MRLRCLDFPPFAATEAEAGQAGSEENERGRFRHLRDLELPIEHGVAEERDAGKRVTEMGRAI